MPITNDGVDYFTLKEISKECGKAVDTLRRWKKDGKVTVTGKRELSTGRWLYTFEEKSEFVKYATTLL